MLFAVEVLQDFLSENVDKKFRTQVPNYYSAFDTIMLLRFYNFTTKSIDSSDINVDTPTILQSDRCKMRHTAPINIQYVQFAFQQTE